MNWPKVVVIANGVRAGRRSAFAERATPTAEAAAPVVAVAAGESQDGCCAQPTGIALGRRS